MDTGKIQKMMAALGDDGAAGAFAQIGRALERVDWLEDLIEQEQKLRPEDADLLYHAFSLMKPTHPRMETGFIYQSHCREVLRRVRLHQDTRPGTYAEVACACSEASMIAPMTDTGFGTYARAWNLAGFPQAFPDQGDTVKHVEGLHGQDISDMLARMQQKLADPDRTLRYTACAGMHHGEPATQCPFAEKAA